MSINLSNIGKIIGNAENRTQGCWVRSANATSVLYRPSRLVLSPSGESFIAAMPLISATSKMLSWPPDLATFLWLGLLAFLVLLWFSTFVQYYVKIFFLYVGFFVTGTLLVPYGKFISLYWHFSKSYRNHLQCQTIFACDTKWKKKVGRFCNV